MLREGERREGCVSYAGRGRGERVCVICWEGERREGCVSYAEGGGEERGVCVICWEGGVWIHTYLDALEVVISLFPRAGLLLVRMMC